jgi:hypothetical protein
MRQISLKSLDTVVAIKIALQREQRWTFASMAEDLAISASQVFAAVKRCELAGLVARHDDSHVARALELTEFVLHGVRFAFPAALGPISRGMPTASAGPYLSTVLIASVEGPPVWPYADGQSRGPAVTPFYPALPRAAARDSEFYNVLTLVDAIRIGGARDREIATNELRKKLR